MSDPPPPHTVPMTATQEDADADEHRRLAAHATAELSEVVWVVLQEAQRQGVDLPEGFVAQMAEKIPRRAISGGIFERLVLRAFRMGVDRGVDAERGRDD